MMNLENTRVQLPRLGLSRVHRHVPLLQLLVGVILVLASPYMSQDHLRLIARGHRAQGHVVAYEQASFFRSTGTSSNDTKTGFMPIVEFSAEGRVVRFRDWLASRSTGNLPDRVTVLYDADNPAIAMIDRPVMNWMPWMPIAAVGLSLIFIGARRSCRGHSSGNSEARKSRLQLSIYLAFRGHGRVSKDL